MFKKKVIALFKQAGVTINGDKPWDMRVHSDRVFFRALLRGNLGLGETYLDGDWDCQRLDEFFYRIIKYGLDQRPYLSNILAYLRAALSNAQKISRAFQVGKQHYDIGNDLYSAMLDPTMSYSCGYWPEGTASLEQAQLNKLNLICRKIHLQPSEQVLDIGCGWGGFADYAATNFGAKVTGLTISKEQAELARKRCAGKLVTILFQDYRKFMGKADKVISVGMFEHVGQKNYRTFMRVVDKAMKTDGIFLLHTIGALKGKSGVDPWIEKYIFPNGTLPNLQQILNAADGIFIPEDIHNFGPDYDLTLMAWWQRFNAAWPELKKNNAKYNERFYRMWQYYFLSCAGAFRSRKIQLYQIVFTKKNAGARNYVPAR